jgi:hypothetical protein
MRLFLRAGMSIEDLRPHRKAIKGPTTKKINITPIMSVLFLLCIPLVMPMIPITTNATMRIVVVFRCTASFIEARFCMP